MKMYKLKDLDRKIILLKLFGGYEKYVIGYKL